MKQSKGIRVVKATMRQHLAITKIARQSGYTKNFTNMIFSGEQCYKDGRIRIAKDARNRIVGFSCHRDRKRDGVTVLYFVGVEENQRNLGIGTTLLVDLWRNSGGAVECSVMKDNPALRLYRRLGFKEIRETYEGKGLVMRLEEKPRTSRQSKKGAKRKTS